MNASSICVRGLLNPLYIHKGSPFCAESSRDAIRPDSSYDSNALILSILFKTYPTSTIPQLLKTTKTVYTS